MTQDDDTQPNLEAMPEPLSGPAPATAATPPATPNSPARAPASNPALNDFLSKQSPERIAKIKSGDRAEAEALANEYNASRRITRPQAPRQIQSFTKAEAPAFLGTIEKINPVLHSRIKNGDATAAQEALDLDARYFARFQSSGLSDLQDGDLEFFRWANARGLTQSNESGLSRFGNGLLNMVKGTGSLLLTAGGVVAGNPGDIAKFAATAVEGAQQGVSEYEQLGAGLAKMTAGLRPGARKTRDGGSEVRPVSKTFDEALKNRETPSTVLPKVNVLEDAAKFELTRYAQAEERAQGEWRRRIGGEAFAAVEVDPNAVEVMSEITDVSNLAGAGLGKAAVTKAATAGLLPEAIAKAALTEAKLFRPGVSGSLSALEGQARVLSAQSIAAREALLAAEQKVTSARLTAAQLADADRADFLKATVKPLEAEAETARKGFLAVETKLTENRNAVTAALDSEGVSVADAVAGRATAAVGSAVEKTGTLMTKLWDKSRNFIADGIEPNPLIENGLDAASGGATAVIRRGNVVTRVGRDLKVVGEIWAHGETTLPFYRRLRQSQKAGRVTRTAAAFIDWSNLGWAAGKTSELTKSAIAGAPVSGAFGYVASGGDVDAALESAGAGAAFGIGGGVLGQWEAYSTPGARFEELQGNRRAFRQWLSDSGDRGSQLALFDKLDSVNQLLIATYAHAAPDVAFMFEQGGRGGPAGRYDRERNVIVLNTDHKDPVAQTFAHEVAHFVERHGLQNQVRDAYLGNAETGQIGEFTKIVDGKPAVIEGTNPDGSASRKFELNDEGRKLKEQYESAVRKFQPDFVLSDEGFASELFAEAYANRIFSGEFLNDLRGGPVEALANSSLVKGFLGKVGMVFDAEGKVIGTGLFEGVRRNRSVEKLIREYNRQSAKGARGEISDDVDLELTEEALKNADVAVKWLQAGGSMKFDAEGKPVYNTDGTPQFLTAKEADQVQRDLAAEIVKGLDEHIAANPDGDAVQRREITDVNGQKRVLYAGAYIPSEVIDKIEAQKRFNPHQLAFLRAASQTVRQNGPGAMVAHFYQAATKKGSKGYKSVAGRWRRDGIYGFQITSEGNITVSSFSWEQLFENARKASRTKKARELWGTSGEALDAAIAGDAVQYLQNLAGKEPGATLLGEDKRDFLNNLLGIRMKGNEGANPFFETTASPKTIITSLRLDRMNRFTPLDVVEFAWGPEQYRRAKENLTPGSQESSDASQPAPSTALPEQIDRQPVDAGDVSPSMRYQRRVRELRRVRPLVALLDNVSLLNQEDFEEAAERLNLEDQIRFRAAWAKAHDLHLEQQEAWKEVRRDLKSLKPAQFSDLLVRAHYATEALWKIVKELKARYDTPLRRGLENWHNWSFSLLQHSEEDSAVRDFFSSLPTQKEQSLYRGIVGIADLGKFRSLRPGDVVHLSEKIADQEDGSSANRSRARIGYVPFSARAYIAKAFSGQLNKAHPPGVIFAIKTRSSKNPEAALRASSGNLWREAERVVPVGTSFEVTGIETVPNLDQIIVRATEVAGKNLGRPLFSPGSGVDAALLNGDGSRLYRQVLALDADDQQRIVEAARMLQQMESDDAEAAEISDVIDIGGDVLPRAIAWAGINLEFKPVDSVGSDVDGHSNGDGRKLVRGEGSAPRASRAKKTQLKGSRLPHAVSKATLDLVHFSSNLEGHQAAVDPAYLGKGQATPNDLRGLPGSFYFIKGSALGADREIVALGRTVWSARVAGSRIYDSDAGNDTLGYWDERNREKADQMLVDHGYAGFLVTTPDGRKVVKIFEPLDVLNRGIFGGGMQADYANRHARGVMRPGLRGSDEQFTPGSGLPEARQVAESYAKAAGIEFRPHSGYAELPEASLRQLADYFEESAEHNPRNPQVQAAYAALISQVRTQFEAMTAAGIKVEPWNGEGEPYASSQEMIADIRDRKHLWFFTTDAGFGSGEEAFEHPMLQPSGVMSGGRELLANDLFRAVHDYFGHAQQGFQFGPRGEFNAYLEHSTMFTEEALPALAAETLAQNAWVNFGPHLRRQNGSIPARGEPGYIDPKQRPFAEQKAFLVPAPLMPPRGV